MDSHELIGRSGGNRWIPLGAVIQDDFRQILRHWAFLLWAGLALVLPILWMMNASGVTAGSLANMVRGWGTHETAKPTNDGNAYAADSESQRHLTRKPNPEQEVYIPFANDPDARRRAQEIGDRQFQPDDQRYPGSGRSDRTAAPTVAGSASQLGGKLLGMHLLVWIGFALTLGACAISTEFASIGESVMCWGVARWQYFLGKLVARGTAAFLLVMVFTLPMLFAFNSKAVGDLAFWPSIKTTFWCACVVSCVVATGVAAGVWFRTSMRAVAVSLMALVLFGGGCYFFAPTAYSPFEFVGTIPAALQGIEFKTPNETPTFVAYFAGGLCVVSLGKFMWADL